MNSKEVQKKLTKELGFLSRNQSMTAQAKYQKKHLNTKQLKQKNLYSLKEELK